MVHARSKRVENRLKWIQNRLDRRYIGYRMLLIVGQNYKGAYHCKNIRFTVKLIIKFFEKTTRDICSILILITKILLFQIYVINNVFKFIISEISYVKEYRLSQFFLLIL